MAMSAPLLSVEGLSFGYGRIVVGRDVSLTLRAGETLALLGPNGGGKTTLFRTVLGLLPPLAGTVAVEGESIAGWAAARRARAFGYVPQAAPGYFPFTAFEMVLMGRTARLGVFAAPSRNDRAIAGRALAELGVARLAERDFTRLSGGERQLVLIARALAQEPRILILDEPTASLDFANQLRMLDVLDGLRRRGLGVVFSTHHPDQALAVATDALLLKDGRVEASGQAADVLTAARLSALFGVAVAVEEVAGRRVCVPAASREALPARS
jgi:iron complex transport system ATP-binding protein